MLTARLDGGWTRSARKGVTEASGRGWMLRGAMGIEGGETGRGATAFTALRESERGGGTKGFSETRAGGETERGAEGGGGGGVRLGGVVPTRRGRGGGVNPLTATDGCENDREARWRACPAPTLCPLSLLICLFAPPSASNTSRAAPAPHRSPPLPPFVARGLSTSSSPEPSACLKEAGSRISIRLSLALAACPRRAERSGEEGGDAGGS